MSDLPAPPPAWRARLALAPVPAIAGGVWLHGASVGEIASAEALVAALRPHTPMLASANTATGRARAAAMGLPAVLAPLDLPGVAGWFLDRTRPAVAVTLENELWPLRARALRARGIAQVMLGARLSARSAGRWARLPGLARGLLGGLDAVSAQDADSEARLLALGLRPEALLPRVSLKRWSAAAAPRLAPGPERAGTVLLATIREDEEAAALAAVAGLRAAGWRVILAPRHPDRFAPLAQALRAAGLAPALRSEGAAAEPLLLADSMGEMPLWYARAAVAAIGGGWGDGGGHAPWEAAAQGCAIVHGPRLAAVAGDYAALRAAGAAETLDDLAVLPGTVAALAPRAEAMGRAARAVLDAGAEGGAALVDAILRLREARLGAMSQG